MKKSTLRAVALVWAALMIAVLSSTVTLFVSGRVIQQAGSQRWVSQEEYETIERYRRLDQVRDALMSRYYRELDEDTLILGSIRGMTASVGDRYTFYYTPEEMKRSNEDDAGAYLGIGTLLQSNSQGQIEALQVYPNSPAEAAGLKAGDVILAVDGVAINGLDGRSYNNAVARVRGGEGTEVVLTVLRGEQRMEIPIMRGEVNISYASYKVLPGDIGYISITQFTGDAADVFREAIDAFVAQHVRGLVIDVRNNPGGYLDQVVSIADRLLPKGLIVYVKERDGTRQNHYSDEAWCDLPLAILVNDMSASASEILASAIQAFDRGTVVGLNTYGKGIVQSLISYSEDGAGLQLTTASYYDALDRCPHEVGVKPDIEIPLDGERVPFEPDPQSDNQLAAAIEDVERQIAEANRAN